MTAKIIAFSAHRKERVPAWQLPEYRHLELPTLRETKEWRAVAAVHKAAREKLNALIERDVVRQTPEFSRALEGYRLACLAVLAYSKPRPRHIPSLIRCAADVLEVADPAWNHPISASFKESGISAQMLAALYLSASCAAR